MKSSARRTLKTIATGTLAAAFLAAGAAAASAHVKVAPDSTTASGYTHVTFSVPNESDSAKTSKLVVKLPTDPPFTSVSVKPVDGWTAKVITTKLPKAVTVGGSTVTEAATSVEWTADTAHQIGQNEYQTFSLSLGKLPAAGTTVMLPAAQTYTDGTVVNWDQKMVAGQAEPEHPAPSFVTTAAESTATAATPINMDQTSNNAVGIWGIVLGAVALVLGGTALGMVLAGRRKASSAK
ncbi:nuclear export factor GLE1 [Arthrobacter livingstonensis]|uniref:Nuclear export factor GLE1 n=1 Tax=Arthrobacter livingstonensis TaxID=670078 RepID=A0A2V5L1B4_9MICC|nr:YcnI family protein [Arthrobacter livingstonensis]PYI63954.1 nuclear export factor GLE1 [Arthrobacter livingstonensis]